MKTIRKILLAALLAYLYSCSSPLDEDTPRTIIYNNANQKVAATFSNYSIEQNGQNALFDCASSTVIFDTSHQSPRLWINLTMFHGRMNTGDSALIRAFALELDSIPALSTPISLSDALNSYGRISYIVAQTNGKDTTIDGAYDRNSSDIHFSIDYSAQDVWAFLTSKIFKNTYLINFKDTLVKDTSWVMKKDTIIRNDSLIVVTNPEMVIKDTTKTITYQSTRVDSIFIDSRFKFKY